MSALDLRERKTSRAHINKIENGWRLELNNGEASQYRLAQLDNYAKLARSAFPQRPALEFRLRARASHAQLPGTWGFGLWNDPFGLSLGFGATALRLPVLPNAAWFFFASRENYLALDDKQAANGALAAVFSSPRIPALLLSPALVTLPLLALPSTSRWLRRKAAKIINHRAVALSVDATAWHSYSLTWRDKGVIFAIDGTRVLETTLVPRPPMAMVLWMDNQHAAWQPDGRFHYGTLATPQDCWVEIKDVEIH